MMRVKTSYDECGYITAGKVYDVTIEGIDEIIINDNGDRINITGPTWGMKCPHLDDVGEWELVEVSVMIRIAASVIAFTDWLGQQDETLVQCYEKRLKLWGVR